MREWSSQWGIVGYWEPGKGSLSACCLQGLSGDADGQYQGPWGLWGQWDVTVSLSGGGEREPLASGSKLPPIAHC